MSRTTKYDLTPLFGHEAIPNEIWIEIFLHIEWYHVLRVSRTCHKFRNLCKNRALWRQQCLRAGLLADADPMAEAVQGGTIDWEEVFKQRTRLKQNWRSGNFTNFILPHPDHPNEGHTDDVYAVQICGKFLVSGSLDTTVRVWDLELQRLVGTEMRGHNSGVLCLQCDARGQEDVILTGSESGELISWRFSTRSMMRVLRHAHSAKVLDIKLDTERNLLVTNSADLSIKIWVLDKMCNLANLPLDEPFHPSRIISGHQVYVNAIDFVGNILVGACADRTLMVWSISDGTCTKRVLQGRSLACVGIAGDQVLCGGTDNVVTVWDSCLKRAKGHLRGHKALVTAVRSRVDEGMLDTVVSASHDGSIILRTNLSRATGKAWSLKLDKAFSRCQMNRLRDKAGRIEAAHGHRNEDLNTMVAEDDTARASVQTYGSVSGSHCIFSLDFNARWLVCCSTARDIVGWDFVNRDPAILRSYARPLHLGGAHQRSSPQRALRLGRANFQASIATRCGRKPRKPNRLGFETN